ncbi:MAG: thioesterase family protein [Chloroflexota bacterium]|nr:thioesterase family protein [Chloroflexota bacterium]
MSHKIIDKTKVRVRYAETDAMGIVHHSQYIVWFEVGRSSYMRNSGFSYADLEKAGFFFRIAEIGARYGSPAVYDELLLIRTWLKKLDSRGLTFSYAVVRPAVSGDVEEGQVLVTGFTRLICTDFDGQIRRLPQQFREIFAPMVQE